MVSYVQARLSESVCIEFGCSIFSQEISYHLLPVRNLLMMSAVFSLVGGFILFIASVTLLDSLRKEDERAFRFWLWTMVSTYGIQIYDT